MEWYNSGVTHGKCPNGRKRGLQQQRTQPLQPCKTPSWVVIRRWRQECRSCSVSKRKPLTSTSHRPSHIATPDRKSWLPRPQICRCSHLHVHSSTLNAFFQAKKRRLVREHRRKAKEADLAQATEIASRPGIEASKFPGDAVPFGFNAARLICRGQQAGTALTPIQP